MPRSPQGGTLGRMSRAPGFLPSWSQPGSSMVSMGNWDGEEALGLLRFLSSNTQRLMTPVWFGVGEEGSGQLSPVYLASSSLDGLRGPVGFQTGLTRTESLWGAWPSSAPVVATLCTASRQGQGRLGPRSAEARATPEEMAVLNRQALRLLLGGHAGARAGRAGTGSHQAAASQMGHPR